MRALFISDYYQIDIARTINLFWWYANWNRNSTRGSAVCQLSMKICGKQMLIVSTAYPQRGQNDRALFLYLLEIYWWATQQKLHIWPVSWHLVSPSHDSFFNAYHFHVLASLLILNISYRLSTTSLFHTSRCSLSRDIRQIIQMSKRSSINVTQVNYNSLKLVQWFYQPSFYTFLCTLFIRF